MLKRTVRCLAPAGGDSTTPVKLLGFVPGRLTRATKKKKTFREMDKSPAPDEELTRFLKTSLNAYPINVVVRNKARALSYHLKRLVSEIEEIQDTAPDEDPNDLPLLIDYKVIDATRNKPLHRAFCRQYPQMQGVEDSSIVVVSFTKEGLDTDTSFISSFQKKYEDAFGVSGCIVNTHTYPYLRDLSRSKNGGVGENMYNIAALGLVKVHKQDDGSLVLTRGGSRGDDA